jgi:subtilisin family serine protease
VTSAGAHAAFSNSGPWVSVAAPGDDGTSFAAPHVAAAAARVWAANPSLTARRVAAILRETASRHGTRTDAVGFGVVDVSAALALVRSTR